MGDAQVGYELEAGVATLRMDDGKANALSEQMIDELLAALDRAEEQARAVLLVGRPGRFCAGFDLKAMMQSREAAAELVTHGGELLMRLYGSPLPVVAACTGHALAGGALLLLTADARVGAAGDFKIGLNEISIGMPLPILGQELARDRLDPRRLNEAILFAKIYDATGAAEVGYLDRVTAPEAVVPEAMAVARQLAALSGVPYASTKAKLRGATIAHIRSATRQEMESFAVHGTT